MPIQSGPCLCTGKRQAASNFEGQVLQQWPCSCRTRASSIGSRESRPFPRKAPTLQDPSLSGLQLSACCFSACPRRRDSQGVQFNNQTVTAASTPEAHLCFLDQLATEGDYALLCSLLTMFQTHQAESYPGLLSYAMLSAELQATPFPGLERVLLLVVGDPAGSECMLCAWFGCSHR